MKNKRMKRLKKIALGVMAFSLLFVQACKINSNRPDEEKTDIGKVLISITISPANPTLADPSTQQFTAIGTYANGSTADITESVNWVSEYPIIATVSDESNSVSNPKGLAKTVITGSTTITARFGDIVGSTTLSVTSAMLETIEVTPRYPSYAETITPWVQFKATGIYNDGTVFDLTEFATWSSSNRNVAEVNNVSGKRGLAASAAAGETTITAIYQGVSGSTNLTLNTAGLTGTLSVTPFNPTLARKTYQQFTATAKLDNGKSQNVTNYVIWESATTTTATISNAAESMGLSLMDSSNSGTSSISADLAGTTGISSDLTVSQAYLFELHINPGYPSIAPGIRYQLKAIGLFKFGSDYYSQDLTEWVSWSSSDSNLVFVSNAKGSKGLVTQTKVPGVAERSATITVKSPLLTTVTGTTTLTLQSNAFELNSIEISPSSATHYQDSTQIFKAVGVFSNGTNAYRQDISHAVVWSSSDNSIAVINNGRESYGKVIHLTGGEVTIRATLNEVSGTATLTVIPDTYTASSIAITPASPAVGTATDLHLTATATFSDGTDSFVQDVTESVLWSSSDETMARVSNAEGSRGVVTGIAAGAVNITADWKTYRTSVAAYSSATQTESVTVEDIATLSTLDATTDSTNGPDGSTQLTAIATYASSNTQDVTESAIWTSSRPAVATVINVPGSKGKVFNNNSGSTKISIRFDDETTNVNITVE